MADLWETAYREATAARCRLARRVGWLEGAAKAAVRNLRAGAPPEVVATALDDMLKERANG